MKKILIILMSFILGFCLNTYLYEYNITELQIKNVVKNNKIYCEGNTLYWGNAEDKSLDYCSDFKGLEIKTEDFILPCQ
ncbi:MAG: hypothetical protein Q9M94_03445 [Candidatus Gracilibacteria bacterium]|nr:hypothetical protein [Candidatus Gracilibacteria bacterium]MDQ7022241.1 hypothetical protein [Candidatus Gracilibacteria bacterium]